MTSTITQTDATPLPVTAGVATTATASKTTSATTGRFLVFPVVTLILAQMGTSGDNGALAIATSALTTQLHANMASIQLSNMMYPLIAGSFMVAGGFIGTLFGWKRTFRVGAVLCAIGEIISALSPNIDVFNWGGRTFVGLGASLLIPSVLGLIPKIYKGGQRTLAFGCVGAAAGGFSSFLPLALGIVMGLSGFRVVYGVLAAYFIVLLLLSFRLPPITRTEVNHKFDTLGVTLAAIGFFLVLFGLSRISAWGLTKAFPQAPFTVFGLSPAIPLIVVGAIVLIVLGFVEKGVEERNGVALLPQSFLKTPQVLAGLYAWLITFLFLGVQGILMGPYLQLVAGWSAAKVGVISVLSGLPTIIVAIGLPKVLPNANPKRVIQLGYIVMILALVIRSFSITLHSAIGWLVFLGTIVTGIGVGLINSQASNVIALAVNERDASQSGGVQGVARNIGQALGVGILGAVLLFGITANVGSAVRDSDVISPEVASAVTSKSITLVGDRQFEQEIADVNATPAEKAELVRINADVRYHVTRVAYVVAAAIVAVGLLTTRGITKFRADDPDGADHAKEKVTDR